MATCGILQLNWVVLSAVGVGLGLAGFILAYGPAPQVDGRMLWTFASLSARRSHDLARSRRRTDWHGCRCRVAPFFHRSPPKTRRAARTRRPLERSGLPADGLWLPSYTA